MTSKAKAASSHYASRPPADGGTPPASAALTRDDILAAADRVLERVEVPEWGGHVFVGIMSAADRDGLDAEIMARNASAQGDVKKANANFRAYLVALTATDANGVRLFSPEDAEALGLKSSAAINRLYDRAAALNGLTSAAIEELEKN